jgi:hypothetical protein
MLALMPQEELLHVGASWDLQSKKHEGHHVLQNLKKEL